MSTTATDRALQRAVLNALALNAKLVPGEVAVSVRDGVVILSGYVWTYAEKCEALDVAQRSSGVNAVADEVRVNVPASFGHADSTMARTLLRTATDDLLIPIGAVHITVQNGWVTLTGRVTRRGQCTAIEHAARRLIGFTGISNLIEAADHTADSTQPQPLPPMPNDPVASTATR